MLLTPMALALLTFTCPAAAEPPTEMAHLTRAPEVPPPITRRTPAIVHVDLAPKEMIGTLEEGVGAPTQFNFRTYNGGVPGPFIRTRVGDWLDVSFTNSAENTMAHNVDFHAVTGPGGGARLLTAKPGETKRARFKLLNPGLYVYHCAAPMVTDHIANGMYGLILVEPEGGLPKVDREFYIMQGEFYTREKHGTPGLLTYSHERALEENPEYVVFNGAVGALQGAHALQANVGDTIRVFFGNAGPNLASSWHVIGEILDRVWIEGGLGSEPLHNIQSTLVPAGGSTVAEIHLEVPGDYTIVDHSIFRIEKGAIGNLHVSGPPATDVYAPLEPETRGATAH
jgi:nitrite reductase (NO-forming)